MGLFMTVKEASALWGYSESTIREWCKAGLLTEKLSAQKVANRWQIPAGAQCPKPIKKKGE